MQENKYKLILASKSPRRKELLGWLNIPFSVDVVETEELSKKTIPSEIAQEIAACKGHAVLEGYRKDGQFGVSFFPVIVASDTIVCYGDKIFGKPKDYDDAKKMLQFLAEKTHQVVTAVYIGSHVDGSWKETSFSCQSDVTFDPIADDLLDIYLSSGEPFDKAGSYGIQGQGLTFISKVVGSYSNVVGFPLSHFVEQIRVHFGTQEWRSFFEQVD